jgi:hypothetical protein
MTGAGPIQNGEKSGATAFPVRGSDLLRLCLAPLFVLLCYQFEWSAWRASVCDLFVQLAAWTGIPAERVSPHSFTTGGRVYAFEIACTALDAFCGSIPLLWSVRRPWIRNLAFFAAYFAVLNAANLLRLDIGLAFYLHGVPWWLAHEAAAGVCYFVLFLWIANRRGWTADCSSPMAWRRFPYLNTSSPRWIRSPKASPGSAPFSLTSTLSQTRAEDGP